ncbi:hypothetical protein [Paenibacillus macquariensis]|uniref:Uncharacterized protein n=1 Tax=Paenibacillus macquariensis TaxID=948756 RepID=A0ABY1K1D1_9BACL|nr:hypothetical protein [Paenibacillus macquariensis]MEC0091788.1 hypothetical protein [Paenibacillus macquariensis]OAB32297.1 hypothetical protein PMSM_16950 [Paenibacillus macquariensis subsp. macquariensis]SIR11962.1 hypothetical protein SAMN05421578_107127 [Paenibacillus macquariensis]
MFNKITKSLLSVVITLALIISITPQYVAADSTSQGSFFYPSFTASLGSKMDNSWDVEEQAARFNYKSGATYTAVSDNSKVVKVTGAKVGKDELFSRTTGKVFMTGMSTGSANVTLKETIKDKTKSIGTLKVKVVNADIGAFSNLKHEFGIGTQSSELKFNNRNTDAIYTFTSNKTGLAFNVKDSKDKNSPSIMITATEYGTYVVSVSETFNGKTKKIKDITFNIKASVIPDSFTVKEAALHSNELVKYADADYEYGLYIPGQDVFKVGYQVTNHNPDSKISNTDYTIFAATSFEKQKIGSLFANKSGTVTAELYRVLKTAENDSEAEFIKKVTVTFKLN